MTDILNKKVRTGRPMQQIQKENKDLRRSVTELREEVRQLKEELAEKDGELSIKRRQISTVPHVDTLAQLNQTMADLKVSQDKCADLEEKLQKGTNDSHQSPEHGGQQAVNVEALNMELSKREETLKLQFLEKEKQMEAWMRQKLISMEEEFNENLLMRQKHHRQISDQARRRQQLQREMGEEKGDCLEKQLATLMEHWHTEAQQWRQQQSELQEKLREQETLLKQQEEERKQETERIEENFEQLWNYFIKKEKKKKKKGVWSRILKFWKK